MSGRDREGEGSRKPKASQDYCKGVSEKKYSLEDKCAMLWPWLTMVLKLAILWDALAVQNQQWDQLKSLINV